MHMLWNVLYSIFILANNNIYVTCINILIMLVAASIVLLRYQYVFTSIWLKYVPLTIVLRGGENTIAYCNYKKYSNRIRTTDNDVTTKQALVIFSITDTSDWLQHLSSNCPLRLTWQWSKHFERRSDAFPPWWMSREPLPRPQTI